jgi:hypothetical protein
MVFSSAVSSLSDVDQGRIRVRFTTIAAASPIGRQIEANIALEARLPLPAAEAIVDGLLREPNDAARLRDKYVAICDVHILSGPPIGGIRPKFLGRAVVLDSFCARLARDYGFRTAAQAEAWLKRQCKLDEPALRVSFARLALGGAVVWATFRESARDEDPFLPLPMQPQPLHDALALDPKDRGRPLLLFVYTPPDTLVLHFPTVADARWGRLFRPAINDPACLSGLTAPPIDDPDIKPLPETVHATVFGDILSMPLRIIR